MDTRGSFREADHSPPSSDEVKNKWSYNSTPPWRGAQFKKIQGQLYLLPLPLHGSLLKIFPWNTSYFMHTDKMRILVNLSAIKSFELISKFAYVFVFQTHVSLAVVEFLTLPVMSRDHRLLMKKRD
jgi:hypothetical protein